MKKRTPAEILLAATVLAGAAYFLFYTDSGRQWLDKLKDTATDQLDQWLADLEEYLQTLESTASTPSDKEPETDD